MPRYEDELVTLPDAELRRHAESENSKDRWAVASDARLTAEVADLLASDPEESVRGALALNPTTPDDIVLRMAEDTEYVRYMLCSRVNAPAAILLRNAADPTTRVRAAVAGNEGTPPDALARLAWDAEEWVQAAALRNASLPAEALNARAAEPMSFETAVALTGNPNLTRDAALAVLGYLIDESYDRPADVVPALRRGLIQIFRTRNPDQVDTEDWSIEEQLWVRTLDTDRRFQPQRNGVDRA
ncbi:hypothetical protein [Curtobacterium sp. MCSS17_016]|uniref:hypothetical protein n=1 Tax=Curtobacterium sp. MCSS17_016 TaxID=2175644 RepID=UPI000DA88172|nr:hypothetical protein [Curtobacterium sp. MCSS17_016]WIE81300.1 hypothetical protein DEJ19_018880 [Curtobacterium sp. MCSS17_016]